MNQYCRYCCNAHWRDEGVFYCDKKNDFFSEEKAKHINRCKDFDFNENDLFGFREDGTFRTYRPRDKGMNQLKLDLDGKKTIRTGVKGAKR